MFFNECLAGFHFLGVERIYFGNFRGEVGFEIDDVVVWAMGWELVMDFLGEYILKVFTPVR